MEKITKEKIINFFKTKGPYLAAALAITIAAIFAIWKYNQKLPDKYSGDRNYPDTFFVTSADFSQYTLPQSDVTADTILINFSQPVDPGHLPEYFTLQPDLKGRFEPGEVETEARFVTETPFERGLAYRISIKAGLPSKIGSKLLEDYTKTLSLQFSADDFKVTKANRFTLLQSISTYEPEGLKAQVGSNVKNPTLKIFSTTRPEDVIETIVSYTAPTWGYTGPSGFTADTSKFKLVTTQENVTQGANVNLPKETGIYLVQALADGTVNSQTWVTVNTLGIHYRQDDQKMVFAAQDLKTGDPAKDIEIKTYVLDGSALKQKQRLTLSGISSFPIAYPDKIDLAIAKKGNEYAYIPVTMFGSLAEIAVYQNLNDTFQNFFYTERPIYKTTDTVKFRGIVRKDNDGLLQLPNPDLKMNVILSAEDYTNHIDSVNQTISVDEHGIYSGEVKLEKLKPGRYYLNVNLNKEESYVPSAQAWIEVKDYVKPPFEITTSADKTEYTEGDQIKVTVKGKNFNGSNFGSQDISYKMYALDYYETEKAVYNRSFMLNGWGGMCGGGFGYPFEAYYGEPIGGEQNIRTNANGEYVLTYDTKQLTENVSREVTFVFEKKDQNGNLISQAQTAVVHNGEINIFMQSVNQGSFKDGYANVVFTSETQAGQKLANQSFDYKVEQIKYEYINEYKETTEPFSDGKVSTNAEGVGEFRINGIDKLKPDFQSLKVSVSKKDARGNTVVGTYNVYVDLIGLNSTRPVLLKASSIQSNLTPGGKAKIKIDAPANMKVLVAFERGRVYDPQWLDLKAGENTYEFPVKDEYMPSITPTFTAFYQNRYYSEGLTFNVPAMKKLTNITVTTDRQSYSPGQVAKVNIKTTNSEGKAIKTNLSLGIIDKAIFALRKSTEGPLHSSFYFFRPRRTNNSSSMTGVSFGEGAESGGGGGDPNNIGTRDVDVLFWDPNLQTNDNGELELFIPVSGTTVWKGIIYTSNDTSDFGQTDFEFSSK